MLTRPWSIWRRLAAACGVAFFAWLLFQVWPVWLQPGPKTTVITGPLKPNGQVDYLAALNAETSEGVTPENNAVVLLIQALGPGVIDVSVRSRYFEVLSIDMPPLDGPYLQSFDQMFGSDLVRVQRANDQMELARKQPWDDDEYPDVAAWLAANEQPLKLCVQACERARSFDPLVVPPGGSTIDLSLSLVQQTRNIGRLLAIRATLHVNAGRIDEALADAHTLHCLSRLVSQHPLFIPQLVAYAETAMACQADAVIVQSGLLTAAEARRQREFRAALPPFPSIADIMDHGERFQSLDLMHVQFLGTHLPTSWVGYLQPNVLLERINAGYDDLAAAMRQPDRASQDVALAESKDRLDRCAKRRAGDEAVWMMLNPRRYLVTQMSDGLVALIAPAAESALRAERRTQTRHTLTLVGFTLAEYRAIHGRWPKSLDALVPEILDRVPLDTFSVAPLKYVVDEKQNTFRIYSVGENGVDDQGRMDPPTNADDISFGTLPEE